MSGLTHRWGLLRLLIGELAGDSSQQPSPWRSPGARAVAPSSEVPWSFWSLGIFTPRRFINLLLELGESGRMGRLVLPSREGRGAEVQPHLSVHLLHLWETSSLCSPCDLEEVCEPNPPTAMSSLLTQTTCMKHSDAQGTCTGDTQRWSHQWLHAKQPDFKLLYWKKQVILALDTRSQLSNAFQSWTSCLSGALALHAHLQAEKIDVVSLWGSEEGLSWSLSLLWS